MKLLLLAAMTMLPGSPQAKPLERFRDQARPLLVFASPGDTRLREQVSLLEHAAPGLRERQVVVLLAVEGGGLRQSDPDTLVQPLTVTDQQLVRQTYGIPPSGFAVILIGKDGGEKQRWSKPVAPQELFRIIDAMPMRQDEIKHSPGRD